MTTELTWASTARELATDEGVLRYHEAGDGPPLLLLHGSGPGVTGWRNFHGNLPVLAARFRCLILEFPGFGVSDATDRHPMMAASGAVTRFLDGLGLDRVDVIGNSMGGIVGAQAALARPDRIRRLVTIGGIGRNIFSPAPGEGIRLLMEFTEDPTRERLVQWLHSMVYDPALVTEELIEERWKQATDPDTLASARRMYGREAFAAAASAPPRATRPRTGRCCTS
ncbi:alpha/beta fold hydrolase [Actinomadura sp. CNU-125]|uniref:alpha/beta fold hydrolase n=1 Tax=Actinomadura sp. CNU-125 TaxID=1904961 RepID=UPI0021CCA349|nr:alpha/beta fold hydrolase [Actinomadura sp. CNU-125]